MAIREQLRKILAIIAEIAKNSTSTGVRDTAVIDRTRLPAEVRTSLNELESLDLIKIGLRVSGTADEKGREYRLINITKEGLKELSTDQDLR